MKSFKYSLGVALLLFAVTACDQEVPELQEPEPAASQCEGASAGTANFTKFVAIGNSFVAGFQAGALFTNGQNNSLAVIMNKQFECVGAPATFNQPDINASLGWNLFITQPFLSDNTKPILGRMLLQGASPRPTPQAYAVGNLEALPNPAANNKFMYAGNKAQLQNFAVPAITAGQFITPATGNWGNPNQAAGFSPFYARFASDGGQGTTTILNDVNAADGTFVLVWLGLDDFFLHAAYGGDANLAPLTSAADFQTRFGGIFYGNVPAMGLKGLLVDDPNLKGVVGNLPNIFIMPHFTSVPYNAIPMTSQAQVDQVNAAYAPYNGGIQATPISAEEKAKRTITFALGANAIVIEDETLTDLSAFGLPSIRQATAADKFPLAAGSVLGTEATPGNPTTVWGVGKALTDRYALIPSEITEIENARTAYNAVIAGVVAGSGDKLALADVNAAMNGLATAQLMTVASTIVTYNINPPTGIFSEDGVHPNSRGYAFLSRTFIEAINAKFGSTIPLTPIGWYKPTALPIP